MRPRYGFPSSADAECRTFWVMKQWQLVTNAGNFFMQDVKTSPTKCFRTKWSGGSVQNVDYCIYLCLSRAFTTKKSAQNIALDLYASHTQRPDQAVWEISITTAWSALGKPVIIVVNFQQFSAHSLSRKKCEIINVKWFKRRPTGDYFYCVFWSV